MLERMEAFFENRLAGYDEHMLASIEGAREFYRFTASLLPMEEKSVVLDLGCGTGLELEEYFLLPKCMCHGNRLVRSHARCAGQKISRQRLALDSRLLF